LNSAREPRVDAMIPASGTPTRLDRNWIERNGVPGRACRAKRSVTSSTVQTAERGHRRSFYLRRRSCRRCYVRSEAVGGSGVLSPKSTASLVPASGSTCRLWSANGRRRRSSKWVFSPTKRDYHSRIPSENTKGSVSNAVDQRFRCEQRRRISDRPVTPTQLKSRSTRR